MKRWMSIDPGASGGWVLWCDGEPIDAGALPIVQVHGRPWLDAEAFSNRIAAHNAAFLVVEDLHAFPGDTPVTGFALGRAVGVLWGIAGSLSLVVHWVRPPTWQARVGMPAFSGSQAQRRKKRLKWTREEAVERWPFVDWKPPRGRVPHEGAVAAAFIGQGWALDPRASFESRGF